MATKGSVQAIIEIAKKELGTIEGPKDNETKYGAWMKVNFQPWCQSFVSWCAFTAGVAKFPKSASTVAAADQFKKEKRWADARNDEPTPGDWIYFDFPEDGVNRISHVGLCIKNNGDGTIQVIEGNTSGTAKGDQRNGGMCVEKTRAYVKDNKKKLINAVVGWGRPVYAGEENAPLLNKVAASAAVSNSTQVFANDFGDGGAVGESITPAYATVSNSTQVFANDFGDGGAVGQSITPAPKAAKPAAKKTK